MIKESIRCELISAGFDVVSKSAILWMTSADNINGLRTDDVREKNMSGSIEKERLRSKLS